MFSEERIWCAAFWVSSGYLDLLHLLNELFLLFDHLFHFFEQDRVRQVDLAVLLIVLAVDLRRTLLLLLRGEPLPAVDLFEGPDVRVRSFEALFCAFGDRPGHLHLGPSRPGAVLLTGERRLQQLDDGEEHVLKTESVRVTGLGFHFRVATSQ